MVSTVYTDFVQPAVNAAWLNDVNNNVYDGNIPPPGTFRAAFVNSGVPTFSPTSIYTSGTTGAAVRDGFINPMWFINSDVEKAAIRNYTSTTDHSSILQQACSLGAVYLPPGRFNYNPNAAALLQNSTVIRGAGYMRSILMATPNGATDSQIINYQGGSILGRAFNPYQTVTGGTWTITSYTSTNGLGQVFKINNNSVTNHSGKTVTITGTDVNGSVQSEVLALPGPNARVSSVKQYRTVTSLTPSATIGADTMDVCLENPYVVGVSLSDFSIILNHPSYNASNYRQVGLDLRNISYSEFNNLYVGNEAPANTGFPIPLPGQVHRNQGYGILVGTRSSGLVDYSGGEGNIIRNPMVYGAYKGISIDDSILCPLSSAAGTRVERPNVQHAHCLITQESPFTAGLQITQALIQVNDRQSGNLTPTVGMSIAGYNNVVNIAYAEMGPFCDKLFEFTNTAKLNKANIDYWFATSPSTSTILDNGTNNSRNKLTYNRDMGTMGGTGPLVELYNKAPLICTWKGSGAGVADLTNGITVTRVALGTYDLVLDVPQPSSNWLPEVMLHTTGGGNALGGVSFGAGTQTTTTIRFYTFSQSAGTTTAIDPVKMWITVRQAV